MKLNPKAVVPTLVHDGAVILESSVICEYLDEVFAEPPLKPSSPVTWCPPDLTRDLKTFGTQNWTEVQRVLKAA